MLHIFLKWAFFSAVCFIGPLKLAAQGYKDDIKALSAVYIEAGGNGDGLSLNYDRIIYQQLNFRSALRAGIGTNFFFLDSEPSPYPIVPVEIVGMIGQRISYIEFGLGYTRHFTNEPDLNKEQYFGRVGLRYQVPLGGLLIRIGFTPYFTKVNNKISGNSYESRFGLAFGYSF